MAGLNQELQSEYKFLHRLADPPANRPDMVMRQEFSPWVRWGRPTGMELGLGYFVVGVSLGVRC